MAKNQHEPKSDLGKWGRVDYPMHLVYCANGCGRKIKTRSYRTDFAICSTCAQARLKERRSRKHPIVTDSYTIPNAATLTKFSRTPQGKCTCGRVDELINGRCFFCRTMGNYRPLLDTSKS